MPIYIEEASNGEGTLVWEKESELTYQKCRYIFSFDPQNNAAR